MTMTKTIKSNPLRAAGVGLLRAVHVWTGRRYRRAMLRRALRQIGREIVEDEKLKLGRLKAEIKPPTSGEQLKSSKGA